jgi:hypothetical protein
MHEYDAIQLLNIAIIDVHIDAVTIWHWWHSLLICNIIASNSVIIIINIKMDTNMSMNFSHFYEILLQITEQN